MGHRDTFSGTPAPPPQAAPQAPAPADRQRTDQPLIDPRNGELINLQDAPSEQLIDVVLWCKHREGLEQTWRRACEDELRRRKGDKRVLIVGDREVSFTGAKAKEWDGLMLRAVLQELVEQGAITAGEIPDGLIKAPQVNGTLANQLRDRLSGEQRQMVDECFREVPKRPQFKVAPIADLADALPT